MQRSRVLGTGFYVPERVVSNDELAQRMDTSDEWIQQRTGICERRHVDFENDPMGASDLGSRAAKAALEDAQISKDEIDCIIYATLSPDRCFPGDGVSVQVKMEIPSGVPAYDLRNQCSGFIYGLQMADALIKVGVYRRVLLIGAEVHSTGLDFSDAGRDVAVLFGDGAGAVVLGPSDDSERGILGTRVHADGRFVDALQVAYPSSAMMPRVDHEHLDQGLQFPKMEGRLVFKHAVSRMPEAVFALLQDLQLEVEAIDLLIPHQANLRICEMVQKRLGLSDEKVFNNIQRYGNTTAGSIPIALCEADRSGRLKTGDLVCLAAFGAGFTWGAALMRW